MTYSEWCDGMERRYDTMPTWYWDSGERRRRYEADFPARNDHVHPAMLAAIKPFFCPDEIDRLDAERDEMLARGDR